MPSVRLAAVLLVIALRAPVAQEVRALTSVRELEIWGGIAQGSPQLGILGETPNMNFAMVALRISRPLTGLSSATRSTMVHLDIIPFALLSTPYTSLTGTNAATCSPGALCLAPGTNAPGLFPNGSAVGVGITPLGITTHFRQDRALSPSIGVTGGAILFDRAAPTTAGARFNYTAAVEAGLRIGPPDRTGIVLTYRFHHISNAGMARENPGVASHLFTIGLRSARSARTP
jgi:Lipid A 3-O-deacylase (PagL)